MRAACQLKRPRFRLTIRQRSRGLARPSIALHSAELLDRVEGNGVRVVLVEDASRFARDLIAQCARPPAALPSTTRPA
jgi:hypothetical protein